MSHVKHVYARLPAIKTTPQHVQEQQSALITSIEYERGVFPEGKKKCNQKLLWW